MKKNIDNQPKPIKFPDSNGVMVKFARIKLAGNAIVTLGEKKYKAKYELVVK